ncbi:hypothetical protein B0F90DRAFT_391281 [Multifurca ochricompacta]|uniref:U6 snRNA phosphodiesterase n=1 Tax=Multifurca ochricompacta TaxID=376703 RepID=A0AAD4QNG0_9AGAM|nr:hypothetical protein B0F90DRAFT_391281 [Multifurca ochricompacta]
MKRTHSAVLVSYTNYSSSSSENEDENTKEEKTQLSRLPVKKRKLPTLAAHLTPTVPIDDPSKHQGRTRVMPHVDGQWAAYVYVPLVLRGALRSVVERAMGIVKEQVPSTRNLGGLDPDSGSVAGMHELHVSLTRPFFLHGHQREEMKRAVRDAAKAHAPFAASFAAFLNLTNDECTRTFLCMEVGAGHQELRSLSKALTATLQSFRQKEYYERPRFHASFAWVLLDPPTQPSLSQTSEPLSPLSADSVLCDPESEKNLKSFPTIPHLPDTVIPTLNSELGLQLKGPPGIFDVGEVRLRIGKDIFSWRLPG